MPGVEPSGRVEAMSDPDQEDMTALCGGEDAALDRIMERWSRPLYGFIFRYVQQAEEASDLVQESFVRVYLNRDRYRPGAKFSTWLFTIAVNLCRNRMRWRRRHPTVSLDADPAGAEGWASDTLEPGLEAERREKIGAVRSAVARLPHELRAVLILAHYQGLSHKEIGVIMNRTPKAVEARLYRARGRLRELLRGEGCFNYEL